MGRQTRAGTQDDRRTVVHRALADGAGFLAAELKEFADCAAMHLCKWDESFADDSVDAEFHFTHAMELAQMSARLAEALAKLRGESQTHQNIRVERMAAQVISAPSSVASAAGKVLEHKQESRELAAVEGEGGGAQ